MKALVRRVVTDYGLLVAGWSVEYNPALRDLVAAHYPRDSRWAGSVQARSDLQRNRSPRIKKALVLQTTADDAFGDLADEVESMHDRQARNPLTLEVAVSRIKRQLARPQLPAIAAHDMLAGEFARLREFLRFPWKER